MQRVAHGLLSGLVCAPALVGALATGCVNGPIDPIELIATDITVDAEHPEMSRLPDGTLAQRYIVVLRNDLLAEGYAPGIISDLVLEHDVRMELLYTTVLGGFAAALTPDQVKAFEARPDVAFVVADLPVYAIDAGGDNGGGNDPGDEARPGGGGTVTPPPPPTSDWGLVDVLGASWATTFGIGNGGAGVTVSVLDTGVDTDHPSLPASAGCLGDFSGELTDSCEDKAGHGTHVTGTIAALASGTGTTAHRGIAPNVSLVPGRVLNSSGSGSYSGIAAGINAAANAGSDVINLSLGGPTNGVAEANDILCIAITNAAAVGSFTAVAAGNEGKDVNLSSPARCDDALTVGAYDSGGKLAWFTNYGTGVDLNAPGVTIYSTTMGTATVPAGFGNNNGTSMASPHAAAVAALYLAANPGSTPAQTAAALVANSLDRGAPTKYSNKITSTKPKLDGRDYLVAPPAP